MNPPQKEEYMLILTIAVYWDLEEHKTLYTYAQNGPGLGISLWKLKSGT